MASDPETQRRIAELETGFVQLRHYLFGNGKLGADERLRKVEEAMQKLYSQQDTVLSFIKEARTERDKAIGGWNVGRRVLAIVGIITMSVMTGVFVLLWRIVTQLGIGPS